MVEPEQVGSGDALSPTTLVLNYLKKAGMQPTGENVRRALEANQRDSSLIPGLINDRPATDAEDRAAMAGSRKPYTPSGTGIASDTTPIVEPQTTSAQPSDATAGAGGGDSLMATLGLIAPSIASAILGRRAMQPGGSVPPMPDVGAGVPRIGGPEPQLQLAAPQSANPMEDALQRALAAPQQQIAGPQEAVQPRAAPPDVVPLPDQSVAPPVEAKPRTRVRARSRVIAR